ncbi:hypothetical protein [Hydrogenovibrio halophilus]|uniref:hypothetical protein n=1 Tax=Hydrogenovibrio halophilus TaxID=373391 RepID=UPI0003775BF1|nr:hypothetical protein [Hydrogenovibrio halophilus]
MKKVLFFIGLALFVALAIMFDWLDARHWAEEGVSALDAVIDSLSMTGDSVQETVETYQQAKDNVP